MICNRVPQLPMPTCQYLLPTSPTFCQLLIVNCQLPIAYCPLPTFILIDPETKEPNPVPLTYRIPTFTYFSPVPTFSLSPHRLFLRSFEYKF